MVCNLEKNDYCSYMTSHQITFYPRILDIIRTFDNRLFIFEQEEDVTEA